MGLNKAQLGHELISLLLRKCTSKITIKLSTFLNFHRRFSASMYEVICVQKDRSQCTPRQSYDASKKPSLNMVNSVQSITIDNCNGAPIENGLNNVYLHPLSRTFIFSWVAGLAATLNTAINDKSQTLSYPAKMAWSYNYSTI